MIKMAVYTAAFGTHDALREPAYVAPGVAYWCARDGLVESRTWGRIDFSPQPDPVRAARRFKLLLHEHASRYDAYVWTDAAFSLEVDPLIFVPLLIRHDLLVMPHPFCGSLEAEATEISRRGLVARKVLDRQLAAYRARKYPGAPHSSTGLLVRRNDRRTAKFNAAWWAELEAHCHTRDQMSFDFVAWRHGMSVGRLEGQYRENPYATWEAVAA